MMRLKNCLEMRDVGDLLFCAVVAVIIIMKVFFLSALIFGVSFSESQCLQKARGIRHW